MIGDAALPIVLLSVAIAIFYFTTPAKIAAARKRVAFKSPIPLDLLVRSRRSRIAICVGLLLLATFVLLPFLHGLVIAMLMLGLAAIGLAVLQTAGTRKTR